MHVTRFINRIPVINHIAREIYWACVRPRGTLVYVGMHKGASFESIFRKYTRCHGFEANPVLFQELQRKFARFPHVHLEQAAVTTSDGEIDFHISSNDGASSSVGEFDPNWPGAKSGKVLMKETLRVPSVNLCSYLERNGIDYVDDYISDIQGMDLTVLKTLSSWIEAGRIGSITCEVSLDSKRNPYHDLPDNSERGFEELLKENYVRVACGTHDLKDGVFAPVPDGWWEMDCRWRCKRAHSRQRP